MFCLRCAWVPFWGQRQLWCSVIEKLSSSPCPISFHLLAVPLPCPLRCVQRELRCCVTVQAQRLTSPHIVPRLLPPCTPLPLFLVCRGSCVALSQLLASPYILPRLLPPSTPLPLFLVCRRSCASSTSSPRHRARRCTGRYASTITGRGWGGWRRQDESTAALIGKQAGKGGAAMCMCTCSQDEGAGWDVTPCMHSDWRA